MGQGGGPLQVYYDKKVGAFVDGSGDLLDVKPSAEIEIIKEQSHG